MMDAVIFAVDGLSVSYGQLQAVRDVTIGFSAGGMTGIFGHNGSGKSSFLKSLVGTWGTYRRPRHLRRSAGRARSHA